MKATGKIIGSLVLVWMLATTGTGRGQETAVTSDSFSSITLTATPVQAEPISLNVEDVLAIRSLSNQQLTALVNALDVTPQIPCATLPRNGMVGNFFSLQHPDWPPLPYDSSQSPVWPMNDFYLLDDVNFDYDAISAQSPAAGPQMQMGALADGGPPPPGGGSGGGGSYTNSYDFYAFNTNALWLEITNVSNGLAHANLHHATNQVYAIWSATNLLTPFSGWQVETEVWRANTNCLPFTVPTMGWNTLFLRAEDWTGVYANGLPCWWTWEYFHTLALNATNSDGQGDTLGDDYTNHVDPNVINFAIAVTNVDVNTANPNLPLNIISGIPAYVAILVNDGNPADAVWQPYTSPNVVAPLGADGDYTVSVGLRGFPTNATETWNMVDLFKNTVAPQLTITNPIGSTVTQMPIQIQGFASKALSTLTLDMVNAYGTTSNQTCFLTGQYYDSSLMAFTTNYFQSDDIYLAGGTNIITLHATDWAGNHTNISFALNYPVSTNPTVTFTWPSSGTVVSGNAVTLQGQVNNPAVTVSATSGTATIQGIVERNGSVWVRNVPLSPGANIITVTAKDPSGNVTTANLNIVDNDVGLVIYPLDGDQLNQSTVDVVGDIDSPSASLVVNGKSAVNSGLGYWEADGVPVSSLGTAIIEVQVFSNGVNIASQVLDQAQPPVVALMSFTGHQNIPDYGGQDYDSINWLYKTGGAIVSDSMSPFGVPAGTNGTGYLPLMGPLYDPIMNALPWEFAAISVFIPNEYSLYQSFTQAKTMIIPGGQVQAGTTNVYLVMARACEYSDTNIQDGPPGYGMPYANYWDGSGNNINDHLPYGGDVGLPPEWLQVNGQPLVNTGLTNVLSSYYGGPSISSVWGATIVAAPAGQNWEVTPSATNVYHNWDYTFFEQASNLTLQIMDANTGMNLSAQTNTVIVGQQMNLTCQLSITNSFMTNFVLTNFVWTVPGYAISNYVVAADASSAMVVTNFSTNNVSAVFYWVDGASNRVVQCSATVAGKTVTAQAVFNIYSPNITFTDSPPSWATNLVDNTDGTIYLQLGDDNGHGNMDFKVSMVSQFTGRADFTQLIDRSAANGTTSDSTGSQYWLDNTRFYLTRSNDPNVPFVVLTNTVNQRLQFTDNPGFQCKSSVFNNTTSIFDQFKDYVMFRPDAGSAANNIYIPIGKITWSWSAATTYSGGVWSAPTYSITRPVRPDGSLEFPQWLQIYQNH